jgi:hypothetical protein
VFLLVLIALDHIGLYESGFWKTLGTVTIACIVVMCAPLVNISPMLSGCALFYGILLFCIKSHFDYSPKRSALIGILLASLVLLKGNFLISAGVVVAAYYLARMIQVRKTYVFFESIVTLMTMIVCLAPWLISNLSFSDTAFYPILGLGIVRSESFGLVDKGRFVGVVYEYFGPFYMLMLIAWLGVFYFLRDSYFHIFSAILIMLAATATVLLALTPGGTLRYAYTILVIPVAFLAVSLIGVAKININLRLNIFSLKYVRVVLVIAASLLTIKYSHQAYQVIMNNGDGHRIFYVGIKARLNTHALPEIDVASPQFLYQETRVQKLQSSIPEHAGILLRLDTPFLFNFSRNRIYVMDWPGAAGPAPGTPYWSKPEDLAHYLRLNGIRYIVYSYANEALHSKTGFSDRLQHPQAWIRNLAFRTFAVQDQLTQLAIDYKVLYDNGNDFVLDLCSNNIILKQGVCSDV